LQFVFNLIKIQLSFQSKPVAGSKYLYYSKWKSSRERNLFNNSFVLVKQHLEKKFGFLMKLIFFVAVVVLLLIFPIIEGMSTFYSQDNDDNETCTINGFKNFHQYCDNKSVESFKRDDRISFSFNSGREYKGDEMSETESYILNLDSKRITGDFLARVKVNYSYTGSRFGQFHFIAGSNYDETGNYTGSPEDGIFKYICYNSIRDPWIWSGGVYEVTAYPFNELDYYDTDYGTLDETGILSYELSRNDGVLKCTTLNQANEILNSHSWSLGINRPLNYIIIGGYVYVEGSDTLSIDYTDFTIEFDYSVRSCNSISVSGFKEFIQIIDDESIASFRSYSLLSFAFNNGSDYVSSSKSYSERYILYLDEWGNISDFQMSIKLSYSYTESRFGAFYVVAGSYYDEEGHFTGTPRGGNYNNIGFNSIRDPWVASNGVHVICAYPHHEIDYYDAGYGSLEKNGVVSYLISREDGIFNCTTVNSEGERIITNSWSSGINRPVNYITIGGYIYEEGSDTFHANYTDFNFKFCSDVKTKSLVEFIKGLYAQTDFLSVYMVLFILTLRKKRQ